MPITPDTNLSIPFKIVFPIIGTIVCATWVLSGQIAEIKSKLEQTWTTANMQVWRDRLAEKNSDLNVPGVAEVNKK